ncbi:MAG: tetratricopeptide repeat protein [Chitinophagaceae bacterium]
MKKTILFTGCFFVMIVVNAQPDNSALSKGNEFYKQSQFDLAEKQYKIALQQQPQHTKALYNLANALYKQKKYGEAREVLKNLYNLENDNNIKSAAFYNEGVSYSREKSLEASIEAYKNALRLNPDDKEARENLQKALMELKQRQQQQKQNQQQKQPSSMSQKQAEQKLKQLQEKERKLQERLNKSKKGNSMPKDW